MLDEPTTDFKLQPASTTLPSFFNLVETNLKIFIRKACKAYLDG